jgi:hypothetical protein
MSLPVVPRMESLPLVPTNREIGSLIAKATPDRGTISSATVRTIVVIRLIARTLRSLALASRAAL